MDAEEAKRKIAAEIEAALDPFRGLEPGELERRNMQAIVSAILRKYLALVGGDDDVTIENVTAIGDVKDGRISADVTMPGWMAEGLGMIGPDGEPLMEGVTVKK